MRSNFFLSVVYNFLIHTFRHRKYFGLSFLWFKIWKINSKFTGYIVETKFNGRSVLVPNGHWYLLVCLKNPDFNRPILAAVDYITRKKRGGLNIIDIGAAVGDTVILIESNFAINKNKYFCFDGDLEYCELLRSNLKFLGDRAVIENALLSDSNDYLNEIEKKDPTTGMAVGKNLIFSKKIDDFMSLFLEIESIDLMKIDVDGFDGRIIAGSKRLITSYFPLIIFEWNVPLYKLVNSNIFQPFEVLLSLGYNKFIWFTNEGGFSFITSGIDYICLNEIAQFMILNHINKGFHFDVLSFRDEDVDINEFIKIFNEYKPISLVI